MRKNKVFVLGAGISQEVGFPSGSELISELSGLLTSDRIHIHPSQDDEFRHKFFNLMNGGFETIDQGLRTPEFSSIKNEVMARASLALLARECRTLLNPFSDPGENRKCFQNSSYRKLFQIWKNEIRNNNSVVFINFNYDRNLETYFYYTEASRRMLLKPNGKLLDVNDIGFDQSKLDSFSKYMEKNFTVYHPYGRINPSEYEIENSKLHPEHRSIFGGLKGQNLATFIRTAREIRTLEHGDPKTFHTMKAMVDEYENGKTLEIIEGDASRSTDYTSIIGAASSAHELYFLGFAYADGNLKRLGINPAYNQPLPTLDGIEPKRLGTGYGLTSEFRSELERTYYIKSSNQICSEFLRSQFGV